MTLYLKRYRNRRAIRRAKFIGLMTLITYAWVLTCYNVANPGIPPAIIVVKDHPVKPISVVVDYTKNSGAVREVTAYTSRVEETDDTPCIAADGSDICKRHAEGEKLCAANFVPLGSKLDIDKFGTCTVADRMNARYPNRVDVYMGNDLNRAIKFGKQKLDVAIAKS